MDEREFDGKLLMEQLAGTFTRRGTAIPTETPTGLTDEFAADDTRRAQWRAFLRRTAAKGRFDDFSLVMTAIREFVLPVLVSKVGDALDTLYGWSA